MFEDDVFLTAIVSQNLCFFLLFWVLGEFLRVELVQVSFSNVFLGFNSLIASNTQKDMNNSSNTSDLLFCPYSDLQTPKRHEHSFSPLASFNDILLNPNPKLSDEHHHLPDSSPSPRFEFDPESLYAVFLQPNNDHDDNDMIRNHHHHHHQSSLALPPLNNTVEDQSFDASETITHMEDSKKISNSRDPPQGSKRKTSKTDRHSKIYTAKGPRDRRMRLSLEVAREFFGLQDMLGFDKASKTVDWLLKQAKPEIKKLARSLPHRFNNGLSSEESQTRRVDLGEVASGWIGERGSKINTEMRNTSTDLCEVASTSTDKRGNEMDGKSGKEKKKRSQSRNPVLRKLPKDARAKARERAKERTKEKMMMRQRSSSEAVVMKNSDVSDQLGTNSNWSSFETGEDSVQEMEEPSPSNRFVACNNMVMNQEDDIAQESLNIINKWSPFSIFNYHHNHGSAASMEHQFTDLHQFSEKPRNAFYNSQNMC